MILLIEIALTIMAWRKGWKGWALLPVGIPLIIGFCMGAAIGANGGTTDDLDALIGFGIVFDLIAIVVLIGMLIRAPKRFEKAKQTSIAQPSSDAKDNNIAIENMRGTAAHV